MTDKHLFVSDLDGTLLLNNRELSLFTINAVQAFIAEKKHFTFATARSLTSSSKYLAALNIHLPVILYNGALVYDPLLKQYVRENVLHTALVADILNEIKLHKLNAIVHLFDETNNPKVFYEIITNGSESAYIEHRTQNGDTRFTQVSFIAANARHKVIEIMVTGTREALLPLHAKLNASNSVKTYLAEDIYYKGFYWLEILHPGATKKQGIEFLKSYTGCEEVTCFGDSINDIPMFEAATHRYAVENSHADLKSLAHKVLTSNENDAVAKFINELRLPR